MNSDYYDLLAAFNAEAVEYLVVGAHALAAHGCVRATRDLDVWVRPDPNNAKRVMMALRRFGAPLQDLSELDLVEPGLIFQIGVEPLRVDVLTAIDGVEFADAWAQRTVVDFAGAQITVLSKPHLIQNKRAAGRLQDLADVEWLERA